MTASSGAPASAAEVEPARGELPREPDDVLGLALRELHRPELGDRRIGQHGRGGKRVDGDAVELERRPVPPDQARARREGEGEVHLLGADRADQHLERVGHERRAQAEEARPTGGRAARAPGRRRGPRRSPGGPSARRAGARPPAGARSAPPACAGPPNGEGRAGPGRRPGDGEAERHQPVPHARHPVERAVQVGARRDRGPTARTARASGARRAAAAVGTRERPVRALKEAAFSRC